MPESGKPGFRLIQVGEDDELVVHAGGGSRSGSAPQAHPAPSGDAAPTPGPAAASPDGGTDGPSHSEPGGDGADPAGDVRRERLRRRAAELADAEAGLEDPGAFPKMQAAVIGVLAIVLVAFVVYFLVLRG